MNGKTTKMPPVSMSTDTKLTEAKAPNPSTDPTPADLMASPKPMPFLGRTYEVKPLNFNDLALMEEQLGDFGSFNLRSAKVGRRLATFVFNREHAPETQLTEEQVGVGLGISDYYDLTNGTGFLWDVLVRSGLIQLDPNEPATEAGAETSEPTSVA